MSADRGASSAGQGGASPRPGMPRETFFVMVLFALAAFGTGLPRLFSATATSTLFLETFGAENLPYVYLATAVSVPIAGFLFLRLEDRLPFSRLLLIVLVGEFCVLLALWFGLTFHGARWLVMAAAVWVELEWVLLGLVFWGLAERIFDIRQAKRLFGVIASGEATAVIAGGLAMPSLVAVLAIPDLLIVSAFGVALGIAIVLYLVSRHGEALQAQVEEEDESGGESKLFADPATRGYVVWIFALSSLAMLSYYFVDNAFYQIVEHRYPEESELAGFLGLFGAASGGLSLFCGLLLYAWLLRRLGISAGLLSLPVLLAIGCVGFLLVGPLVGSAALSFLIACFLKVNDEAYREGIDTPTKRLLYQPLRPKTRIRAEAVAEAFLEPITAGVAGVLLVALVGLMGFGASELLWCVSGLLLAWLILALVVHRKYRKALSKAVERPTFGGGPLLPDDEKTERIILAGLDDADPSRVLHSLNLLEQASSKPVGPHLLRLLDHPTPEVRRETAARIEKARPSDLADAVESRIESEGHAEVKAGLLIALAALYERQRSVEEGAAVSGPPDEDRQGRILELLVRYLDSSDLEVRCGAVLGLMRYGGVEGIVMAGDQFLSMVRSGTPEERIAAARLLEHLGNTQFWRQLLELMTDKDLEVRRRALHAASLVPAWPLRELLCKMLHEPLVRGGAAAALVAAGPGVVPDLEQLLDDPATERRTAICILDVLGKIGSEPAAAKLLTYLDKPDDLLRHQALLGLNRCGLSEKADADEALYACLEEMTESLAELLEWQRLLNGQIRHSLLYESFEDEIARRRHSIFLILSLLFDADTVDQCWLQYARGAGHKRSYALEVIDTLLPQHQCQRVLPVLEDQQAAVADHENEPHKAEANGALETKLLSLLDGEARPWVSEWIGLAALSDFGRLPRATGEQAKQATDLLERVIGGSAPLRRETAVRALVEMTPDDLDRRLERMSEADDEALAAAARDLRVEVEGGRPMLLTIDKIMLLKSVAMFDEVPTEFLVDIARVLKQTSAAPGTSILTEGDFGRDMFIIVEGEVEVLKGGKRIATLGKGEVVGELAALDPEARSASVVALEETVLLRLRADYLEDLMTSSTDISRGIIRMLCGRIRATHAQ